MPKQSDLDFNDVVAIEGALEFLIDSYESVLDEGVLSGTDEREAKKVLRQAKRTLAKCERLFRIQ